MSESFERPRRESYGSHYEYALAMQRWRAREAGPELCEALRFILAFYEPGQTHLDTDAWKVAEASARAALAKVEG